MRVRTMFSGVEADRRGFLRGLLATSVLVAVVSIPSAVRAQALPVVNDAATFQSYTRSAFTNYVKRVGPGLSAAQRATIAAAANDNLAATAVRVGSRSGVAMLAPFVASATPIVAGVVILGAVAAAGYVAYKFFSADRPGAGGKSSTTTYEQALASSNWSLRNKPGWALWKQVYVGGGWEADWLWTPPQGQTQADFDHATDILPYQETKALPEEAHKALDTADQTLPIATPWLQEALHNLAVDTAAKAAAAGHPLPGPFADPATVPAPVPGDFPAPNLHPRPGPGAATKPIPGTDGETSSPPDLASDPDSGANPDPDPDPDPGQPYPPGEAVDPEAPAELPAFSEFVDPFKDLFNPFKDVFAVTGGSCPSVTLPSLSFGQVGSIAGQVIDVHCQMIEPFHNVIVGAAAAAGGWSAVSHILDA